jgi:simple sugar transport system substrate-binding protein
MRMLAAAGACVLIRIPVAMGLNGTVENIHATARFMKENGLNRIELLKLHRLSDHKYAALGLPNTHPDVPETTDADIEAFINSEYGDHLMGILGEMMGGEGQYTTFVGALTANSHTQWVDASVSRQEKEYPKMELISNKNETEENFDIAYWKTRELLTAYPELVGFQGSAMTDVPGVGRAIQEAGKQDSTVVIGTSLVSVAGKYLEDGSIDMISFWDPAMAGYAMNELALILLEGGKIEDGMSLEAEGYQNLKLDGKVLYGSAWVDVTVDNMGDYDF